MIASAVVGLLGFGWIRGVLALYATVPHGQCVAAHECESGRQKTQAPVGSYVWEMASRFPLEAYLVNYSVPGSQFQS